MALGHEVSNPKRSGQEETGQATADHPEGQAGGESRGCSRDRLDALERDPEQHRSQNCADRVDQNPFRFEYRRQPGAQPKLPYQRAHDRGPRHDDESPKQEGLDPRPVETEPRRERRARQSQDRSPGDESADCRLLSPQPGDLKIEPAFEKDDCDRDVDHRDQPVAQGSRIDPSQPVGSQASTRQQKKHDAGNFQMSRNRLGEYPDRQGEH